MKRLLVLFVLIFMTNFFMTGNLVSAAVIYDGITFSDTAVEQNWPFEIQTPMIGDYNGDGAVDVGGYNAYTFKWYIMDYDGNILSGEDGIHHGFKPDASYGYGPCQTDYDHDGSADICFYIWNGDGVTYWIININKTKLLWGEPTSNQGMWIGSQHYENNDMVSWTADFNGDQIADRLAWPSSSRDTLKFYLGSVGCLNDTDCSNEGNSCLTSVCNTTSHACENIFNQNLCDDGNPCTLDDICSSGVCSGAQNTCDDGWGCSIDSCNILNGACVHAVDTCSCTNSSQCDDNNPCTTNTCSGGSCTTTNNIAICTDNNNCTINDTCAQGSCVGIPTLLDDGNLLTLDVCLDNGTIIHTTSFNLSAHLENQNMDTVNPDNPQDSDSQEQVVDYSQDNTDNPGASLPNQDADSEDKRNAGWIVVAIVLIVLILIGLAIFVLPKIIDNKKQVQSPPIKNNSKMPPRGPSRQMPPRRMPPRR